MCGSGDDTGQPEAEVRKLFVFLLTEFGEPLVEKAMMENLSPFHGKTTCLLLGSNMTTCSLVHLAEPVTSVPLGRRCILACGPLAKGSSI